jgi:gas vesicle protein
MTDKPDTNSPTTGVTGTPGPTNPGGAGQTGTQPGRQSETGSTPGPTHPGGDQPGRKGMADTARQSASDAAEAARGMAAEQTERAKSAVAEEVSSVAHALRTAADDLREGSAQERTFAQIADTLADTAEAIRDKDLCQMMQEATDIARRHPMTFLGGAALLGFTAMRFAKASGESDRRRRGAYRSTRSPTTASPADTSAYQPGETSAFQPGRLP